MEGIATATAADNTEINPPFESTEQGGTTTTTTNNATDHHHLIGTYVGIDSSDGNDRLLLGKVLTYDSATKLFTIFYENGNRDVLDRQHVTEILIMDLSKLSRRKRKLDHIAISREITRPNTRSRKNNPIDAAQPLASLPCQLASEGDDDGDDNKDSSTDSCDYDHNSVPSSPSQVQILPLPLSSGDINVPDESVPYLFSVYNFLRSFSIQLFLSPFGLDDFVGSLNCAVQNSLLDAIHLSLMQALRRHIQMLSSEDSKLACKCLRYCDWTLLDSVTWPAILAGYLCLMGYMKELDAKGFSFIVSGGEYYVLPVGLKLKVLQILCDDIVNSEEIRTELEMRVDMEEVDDYSVNSKDPPESGPRRVHPRYTKTSACRNLEALKNSVEPKMPILNSKVSVSDPYASDLAQDANSDECQLCGMDGMLICCDGCPSAYHSRCIGLNKAHLPEGAWFCTECTANKLSMTSSRIGRGTSGAEIFGIDVNGRMFLGTCNYLLVVGTSISESIIRYYNSDSITEVLSVILAAENSSVYTDIYRGISKYWTVPLIDVQPGKPGPLRDSFVDKDPRLCYAPCITSSKITSGVLNDANEVHYMTNSIKGSLNVRDVFQKDHCIEEVNGSTIESMGKANLPDALPAGYDLCRSRVRESATGALCHVGDKQFATETTTFAVGKTPSTSVPANFSEQMGCGSAVTEFSCSSQTVPSDRSILLETATCGSVNENITRKEDASSFVFLPNKESVSVTNESRFECHINDDKYRIRSQMNSQVPALFQPQAYINQYIQGDVAACAAANLAVLASEESNVSEARVSSNPRKAVAANTALQMKAFSGAISNFLWPGVDKKLMEIPRERCGWCIACKAASTWKRGCLLNLVATNALKRFARNFCGLRRVKHVESHLPIVAAQIAHMEESLRGLISGPLLDVQYNKQWHKLAREASSCRVLKFLLLELEENIRGIAFCGEWTKLVDDWTIEFSSAASGVCRSGTSRKRGPGGRRYRKQSETSEFENDSSSDDLKNVLWWRGGKLLKLLFQKGALSSSLVKKMGRQGGTRRISGIYYPEGSELPRRSRQLAWRASVEMSKNVSQLALQVRYLDAHLRWKDLVRPDQSPVDGKGSDVDAMAFRNAVICDKRISENKIKYALTFSIQKHLSLRVTKNILETENLQDGNEKLLFLESHVPLYLIKEYEEKIGLKPVLSPMMLRSHNLLRLRKKQLKGQGDIFSYLMYKGKEPSRLSCPSCQEEVFLRDSTRCNTCQGYCHEDCISIAVKEDDLEFMFLCKLCDAKSAAPISGENETLNTQLTLNGPNPQFSLHGQIQHQTGFKCMLQSRYHNPAQPVVKMEISSLITSSGSGSKSAPKVRRGRQNFSYGLIWKRKTGDDSGQDFRINNILLKGKEDAHPKANITCSLCNTPYRSDLMYICCGNCSKWYHADALQLEEAQIFDLVGYKCCQCRRKASPKCPYADSNYKRADRQTHTLVTAERNEGILSKAPMLGHLSSSLSSSRT